MIPVSLLSVICQEPSHVYHTAHERATSHREHRKASGTNDVTNPDWSFLSTKSNLSSLRRDFTFYDNGDNNEKTAA